MKHLQNTLYILTPGSTLSLQNEAVCVRVGGEERVRVPAHTLESIVLLTSSSLTTPFIGFCGERGIALSCHSEYGRFFGRLEGPVHGNILLRKAQFGALESPEKRLTIVKSVLLGKLVNSRETLLRAARESSDPHARERLQSAAQTISHLAVQMDSTDTVDALRGLEGVAANAYFGAFDAMLKVDQAHLRFTVRSKRPPEDPVNALLSFAYTLLKNDVQSALESVGLDPACGYLHALRPGRPALALDLMEEMRSPLSDRLTLALLNREQITVKSFERLYAPVHLTDAARKTVLTAWQKRKQEEITHPFLQVKIPIGLIPFCQARLFTRYLRGELDTYPPFHWR